MKYSYTPTGVCSRQITFEIEDDKLKNVEYTGGCHGNLQAVAKLVEGMPVSLVKEKLSGIRCGNKPTSCADQLTRGIDLALEKSKG